MHKGSIRLISFGVAGNLTESIAPSVAKAFSIPVSLREGYLDLSTCYDPSRRQYNGNLLLGHIDANFGCDEHKTLAIFNVDLFIPILTYIIGQAYLKGRAGIASVNRLMNERYGLPKNEKLLIDRLQKEVIHELGHTFGLTHCHDTNCVMRSSTYVEEIDQKEAFLCINCKSRLLANSLSE